MFTVLSFGAGQDSTALLYKYAFDKDFRKKYVTGDFMVIFSDTGDEHPHTYDHLKFVSGFCKEHKIEFHAITHEMGYHPKSFAKGLRFHYNRYDAIMSKAMRNKSCSDNLKIKPIYSFLADLVNERYMHGWSRAKGKLSLKEYAIRYGKINMILGIAAGEEKRINNKPSKSQWMNLAINKVYPLPEMGFDREKCQAYIKSLGLEVPFPSNCMLCPFISKIELLWLHRFYPGDYEYWKEKESNKIKKFDLQQKERGQANHGVWGGGKLLDDVLEEAITEYGNLTDSELTEYKMSHGHCVKTKF